MAEIEERTIGRRRGDRVVGSSDSIRASLEQAANASRSQLPVVITGPVGSGKRHLARAIHAWGPRADGELVVLSARGIDASLHDHELLGASHRGNPQSAGRSDGALVRAARGTLLIDGLDDLAASARQGLIQAIRAQGSRPEGQEASTAPGPRIIGTTISNGSSLLGDLPVQSVHLDPLEGRREDILPLAAHFLALFAEEVGVRAVGFTADARRGLMDEKWKGNISELRSRIQQAVRLAGDGAISIESLLLSGEGEEIPSFKDAKRAFETRYVESLLRRCSGNISRAARMAKKDRKDFYDVIRRTGIDPGKFRS